MIFLIHQKKLVLAYLFEPQFLRHPAKVGAELVDVPGVGVDGVGGEVANLHVLGHAVDVRVAAAIKRCHGLFSAIAVARLKTTNQQQATFVTHKRGTLSSNAPAEKRGKCLEPRPDKSRIVAAPKAVTTAAKQRQPQLICRR